MKNIFFIISFSLITSTFFGQTSNSPKNAKSGVYYFKAIDTLSQTNYTEWIAIDIKIVQDSIKLKNHIRKIQYKLINNGFNDIKPTGKLDYLTSHYHNNFKKLIKARKKEEKRKRRKEKYYHK